MPAPDVHLMYRVRSMCDCDGGRGAREVGIRDDARMWATGMSRRAGTGASRDSGR